MKNVFSGWTGARRAPARRGWGAPLTPVLTVMALLVLAAPVRAELAVGAPAPDFSLEAALGGKPFRFQLAEALARGPVVVYFYPKAFTQGCTLEANAFAEASDDYAALGATVIGVSGDDIETLKDFSVSECRNKFAVGADVDGKVMQAYGAAVPHRDNVARRVSFVISPAGEVVYHYTSGSYEQHVPNTLAAIRTWAEQRGEAGR